MKKFLGIVAAATCALALTACSGLNNDNSNNPGDNTNKTEISFNDMYSYSAISAVNILESSNIIPSNSRLMSTRKNLTEEEKTKVLENLTVVENLIAGDINTTSPTTSDRPEFETMYTVSVPTINGEYVEYKYYYNEIKLLDDDDDDHDDEDDNEYEEEAHLEGIVIVNQQVYQMTGNKEIEVEDGQTEEEMSFKISLDENNYVIIEQEREEGEHGFEVSEYQNGKRIYSSEIEFEYNQAEGEYEVSLEEKTANGKREYEYEFYDTTDGKFVEVKIKENNQVIKAYLEYKMLEDGSMGYVFIEK